MLTANLILSILFPAFPQGASPPDIAALRSPGTHVPSASLPNIAGGTLSLLPSGKRPTVIVVFASWCDPCLKNLPSIVGLSKRSAARFIGIDALESVAAAKGLAKKYSIPFPVASLMTSEFNGPNVTDEQRGATGIDIPAVYVIDAHGASYQAFVGAQASDVGAIEKSIEAAAKNR
jgi:thiol-disulfide isomerase/thioredoxin